MGTERLFTGQVEDADSSLYFFNARYLETGIGRFISPDSIVPNPSDPRDHNRYSYVRNNPLKYTDPSGRAVCSYVGEFSDCDSIEDGSNYGAGQVTNFAQVRINVQDSLLETYNSFIDLGVDGVTSFTQTFGPTGDSEQAVAQNQSGLTVEWTDQTGTSYFGGNAPETTDEYAVSNEPGPSTTDVLIGGAEIVAGAVVLGVAATEAYAAVVLVPASFGGSLIFLVPAAETGLAGLEIMSDGLCRATKTCVELPYVPGSGY